MVETAVVSADIPFSDDIRIVGVRRIDADLYSGSVVVFTTPKLLTVWLVLAPVPKSIFCLIDTRSDAVAARAVVAVAVRAAVVRPVDVAVRATVAPVAADVARVAPPVVLAAAARVAAVDVAVRVDVVPVRGDVAVVPRDATVRDAVARGDAVVVRAATTRDEFPFADPRPDAVVAPADAGIARVVVVRFAAGVPAFI